ncbi:immunoglobulin-like domain-containing protein [Psychroserpens mesophilus]|uniref:immunoglobulin-like domain-containing protein n=1 Tax=Psychroserpens mesophilus TaxID=325473 RepID=UPI003D65BB22
MKIKLLLLVFLMSSSLALSQSKSLWQKQTFNKTIRVKSSKQNLPKTQTYTLNIEALKQALINVPNRQNTEVMSSGVVLSFPNDQGKFERFKIAEAPVFSQELQERYPEIRSYIGQGLDDPSAIIRFSVSPLGFQSMRLSANMPATFIEAYSQDLTLYAAYKRADKIDFSDDFICEVTDHMNKNLDNNMSMRNADDSILRTYRLAVSTTGEYTAYHGGTKTLALAAINQTMTRVNGIFENDFNVRMVVVGNNDDVIYTNSSSDPYTSSGSYNSQLQSTLTSVIGESNYDIGHLFARASNNGNAGCIGCVCVNGQKGSGFTSRTDPEGDPFDVDYVAHEIGHQFGGNHTWTFNGNEGTDAQMEPGSGSTIMGYAGITGATDVQSNSDPYFHARSIEQITNYIKTTSCQTNTATGNAVPTVNAGSNYTIPKGTAFVLDGSATDANSGDVLTYCWEQYDENNASTTYPSVNATAGVAFRSYSPTTNTKRYFPRLSTIKTGATSWQWEAVPNVARNLNFRLTVRDNRAGGATNNSDDMVVTVNGTAGPFVVNTPNTNVTWNAGTTQTVTWNVAGTTGNGVNAANVDIFLSTDGGDTYPISLASGVPNDGSHDIVVPNNQGTQCRIMVKGANNIFFDISNSNFTIAGTVVCNANIPTGLAASNVAATSATLSWTAVPGASYDLRYREVGASAWTTTSVNGISSNVTGLTALTQYEAQVRSKCTGGSNSAYTSLVNFTTTDVQLNYCASASTNTNDEYIGRVQLNTIDNSSGAQFYSNFTSISTTLTKDTQYTITVTPTWTGTVYSEGYAVWIDYNRDGDFGDAGELVWSQAATQSTPVSGSFTIPSGAVENSTRMRVSMKYNGIPTSCETFQYGEVEDYTVIIEDSGPDTEAPVISINGASTVNLNVGDTYTELGATATDNVDGNLTSSIIIGGDTVNTSLAGTYIVTYNVSDTAGNAATEVTRTVNVIPDTTAPVITLIGSANINLQLGDSYSDAGATASDNIDGDLTSSIVVGGDTVNTNVVGTYIITYNVSDAAGNNAAEVTRTVTVNPDTTAPVITLNGASTINLNVGDTYNEQGATATDNIDGNLTSSIVISGTVNTASAGTYFVNYNVSDSSGNAAAQVTRTVVVNADTTPPVIVLVGASTINLNVGDTYNEQGATATDNLDGNLTSSIVIAGTVNTAAIGTYLVTYNVSDSAGNAATEVVRTVNVSTVQITYCDAASTNTNDEYISRVQLNTIDNSSGPQFYSDFTNISTTLTKNAQYTITITPTWTGTVYNEAYGVWIDYNKDGDFTDAGEQVFTQGNTQATSVSGSFTIPSGAAETSTRMRVIMRYNQIPGPCDNFTYGEVEDYTVTIEGSGPDTTAPVISLIGSSNINLQLGDSYSDQGATATDNIDGDLTSSIVVGGDTVNTDVVGTYVITYNVSDAAGNAATEVTRTVTVNPDTTAPVITLVGASTINLNVGDTYNEQGATATDNLDGNLTSSIVISGLVNTASAGTYNVYYNVSDSSGNAAAQVTRTINVSESSTGCSGGVSSFPYNEGFENTLGAWTQSSADDINWTVDANGTPSSNTGPSSAFQGSYYVYVEASGSAGYPTKQAILNSPCFNLSTLSEATFTFKYHQYGSANMGTFDLEVSDDEGASWTSIWNSSGNLGNTWQTANVSLDAYVGGSIQLRFNRITGSTWQADIAVDDVSLTDGSTTSTGCSGGITSYPYTEGFESSFGAWTQSVADDLNWTRDANGTPSSGTGPSSAIQGSFYIFVEASGNNTGYPTKQAILNSPCFDLSSQSSATFSFNYHQYGAANMGTLNLEASNDNGSSWTSIWSSSGNLGNAWQSANVNLSVYVGGSVQLRFNRVTGNTWQADLAIDNINLSTGSTAKGDVVADSSIETIKEIKLFPNPVKGSTLHVATTYTNVTYEIYNTVGQTVAKGELKGNAIDVSNLDGAIYQVKFTTEGETLVKRFIKQ